MPSSTNWCILERVKRFKKDAAERCCIDEEDVHIGHIALQAMLNEPDLICQINCETDEQETNKSVARRSCRLASAMTHSGLKPGDPVIIMGYNHMDICIPYFACHFGGFSMCAVDPSISANDLNNLFPFIHPKMIFCQKSCEEKVKKSLKHTREAAEVVIFDDKEADIEAFSEKFSGFYINYRPAEIDQSKIIAWLMLTSGTTGLPKVAMIPFDTLQNAILSWWTPFPAYVESCMAMATLQWMSSLLFFLSGPLKGYTRIQSPEPFTPQKLVKCINTYKPITTAWTPYLLGQFLEGAEDICDLSCFKYIVIGGSAIEKPLLDRFRKKCSGFMYLVYGMTELLTPIFDYDDDTPFGSAGKPQSKYEFRLMGDDGVPLEGVNKTGELWIKGNAFFKGYLNNPEETSTILTDDGWFKTGDMFYKDEQNYYFFVERKRLLIKHYGFLISPLKMEDIIKSHPGVAEACVVGIPEMECQELPVAAVLRKNGNIVDPKDLIESLKKNMEGKRVSCGFFFVDSFPVTPSGKVHRAKVKELALVTEKVVLW